MKRAFLLLPSLIMAVTTQAHAMPISYIAATCDPEEGIFEVRIGWRETFPPHGDEKTKIFYETDPGGADYECKPFNITAKIASYTTDRGPDEDWVTISQNGRILADWTRMYVQRGGGEPLVNTEFVRYQNYRWTFKQCMDLDVKIICVEQTFHEDHPWPIKGVDDDGIFELQRQKDLERLKEYEEKNRN